ncbi:endonuclease/exonuclease/phosphatase family protein [Solirubrobacter deserti]|uniref:Endonuclease/exonuclease/phosphatase family protein n=1 Tax=Solirubrobacter deserti TaxID=2282478 RepID=A0ABT4RIV9_9ACTN|nr:endonuclease/exonuclease/phosphatase family protein [Solirubrobacter deserti]MDA0138492.1 endonuclease/exonuclease/phosphatase family protein [Solirubrobacter deserti]
MKKLVLAGAVALAAAAAPSAQAASLNVATYNIHHAEGVDGTLSIPRIANEIRKTKADVIGLQEVDRHWGARSEFVDQAERLAKRLDMKVVYAPNLDLEPLNPGQPRRQYGTAILSSYDIVSSRNTLLPRPNNGEQRGLLEAVIKVGKARVRVANTHLQHNSDVERTAQVNRILELLEPAEEPTVLLGDLNALPTAPELAPLYTRFDDAWTLGGVGEGFTYPAEAPDRRIDYVFVSPDVDVKKAQVHPTPASDHLPVSAKLQVKPEKGVLAKTTLRATRATEAKLTFTASAPDTDWARNGREAAVVSVLVDGVKTQDVVLHQGARQFAYEVALGRVQSGNHQIRIVLNDRMSPPAVGPVNVSNLKPSLSPVGDLVARHAPILYGRDIPEVAGRWENARTDVPLLSYHTITPHADGTRTIEYTVIWSNEDGGTNSPALMARWGRTTDIEWLYRVKVDAAGNAIAGEFHGLNHVTTPFTGLKEGDHPLLEVNSSNNNMTQVTNLAETSGYRFFLDTSRTLPAGRTREAAMDAEPWTYQVMAKEMLREGRLEATSNPATVEVSDQRNYLWLELEKTGAPVTLAAKVDGVWYRADHLQPGWSIERDGSAATTIELPAGTTEADVEEIKAILVPTATRTEAVFRAVNRGFFLGEDYLPLPSFVQWRGTVNLTAAAPEATVWQR